MAAKQEIARRLGRARLSEGRGSNGLVAPTGERGRKSFGLHRPWTFSSTGTGLGVSRPRPGHGSRRVQDLNARRSDAATVFASPTRTARCLNASGHMAQRARCTVADMVLCAIYGGQSLVGKKGERYSSACFPIVGRRLAVGLGETGRGPHCVVDLLHVSTKVSILEHHRVGSTDEQFG